MKWQPPEPHILKECRGCGAHFWTWSLKKVFCTDECYRRQAYGPMQGFLAKLGGSTVLAKALDTSPRYIRLWFFRGIPKNYRDRLIKIAQEHGITVSMPEILLLNARTKAFNERREKRDKPGRKPVKPIVVRVRETPKPPAPPPFVVPTLQQITLLQRMKDGREHFILDRQLAQSMCIAQWIVPVKDGQWQITQHGRDVWDMGCVKEFITARREVLARRQIDDHARSAARAKVA